MKVPDDNVPLTPTPTDKESPSIRSIVRIVLTTIILIVVSAGVLYGAYRALNLLFLVVLALFLAYILDPLVRLIRRPFKSYGIERFMPRSAAILVTYVVVFAALWWVVSFVAPRVIEQAKEFGANLPTYAATARQNLNELSQRYDRLRIPDEIQAKINDTALSLGEAITSTVGGLLLSLSFSALWLILIPILSFFFLKDVNLLRLAILRTFPAGPLRYRAEVVMQDVNSTLAAYTRAMLISCLLIGIICTIAFYALGLKYALLLGILAGCFELVPLLGPAAIGLIVILTTAFSQDPWKALYAAIFLVILRIVHDYVTYPRIIREGIHLHPIVIILSVLVGEQIAGIPGVFLSIPIVAILTVFYRHYLEHHGRRGLFAYVDDATPHATK